MAKTIKIVIDPGHGKNSGAGIVKGFYEGNNNFEAAQYLKEELEKEAHLGFRALPVFFGKSVNGDVPYAEGTTFAHQRTHGIHARKVPLGAGKAALAGPAAVAVHDDGDMLRQIFGHGFFGAFGVRYSESPHTEERNAGGASAKAGTANRSGPVRS